jgi:hypothetical protein
MAVKPDPDEYKVRSKLDADESVTSVVEMVTWNTNSSTSGASAGTAHYSDIRNTLVAIVKEPIKHCITFMQEIKMGADGVRKKMGYDDYTIAMPIGSGLRDAAVLTPPNEKLELQYVADRDDILNDPVLKTYGVKDKFSKRMCGQKVTLKKMIGESEYTAGITMVSYHAPYKESDSDKREKC